MCPNRRSVIAYLGGAALLIVALASAGCGDDGPVPLSRAYRLATANGLTLPAMIVRDTSPAHADGFITRSRIRFFPPDSAIFSYADSTVFHTPGSPDVGLGGCYWLGVGVRRAGDRVYLAGLWPPPPFIPQIILHDTLVLGESGRLTRDTKLSDTLPLHLEYVPVDTATSELDCDS